MQSAYVYSTLLLLLIFFAHCPCDFAVLVNLSSISSMEMSSNLCNSICTSEAELVWLLWASSLSSLTLLYLSLVSLYILFRDDPEAYDFETLTCTSPFFVTESYRKR